MSDSLFDLIVSKIEDIFGPVADAVTDPGIYSSLLQSLGVAGNDAAGGGILAVLAPLANLKNEISKIAAEGSPSFADIAHVLKSARDAFAAIEAMDSGSGASSSLGGLGKDLIKSLVIGHLAIQYPLAYDLLVLLTIIEPPENANLTSTVVDNGAFRRMPVLFPELHFERISPLLADPASVLRAAYLNELATADDANAMANLLFPRLGNVLNDLGVPNAFSLNASERTLLGDSAALLDYALLIYVQSLAAGAAVEGGVTLALSSADRGDLGLVVTPFGGVSYTAQSGDWTIVSSLTADIEAFAYGKHGVTILASAGTAEIDASFTATLAAPAGGPAFVFGSSDGTCLELGGAKLGLVANLSEATQKFGIDAEVSKSAIVISGGDGDGFVSSLIPKDGLRTDFDFGIAWSNTNGLSFHGAAGLDATIPLNVSLGGVFLIPTAHLALQASDADISLEVSASVGLSLGPLAVLVDRLGVLVLFDFSSGSGSAGVGDFSVAFKPPSGAGIAIDSAGVSGGGFLGFDPAKHEYSGVLQLQFTEFALQAFGLITTQVAGGSGYSLIALVDADFPPIPLGWGFTLNGVGGLFAVHRTANVDALRAALQGGQLATILFPKNAIANAPQILAQLDGLFPTAPGRFLFGPMALIGWGTPNVLTVALAVILELPDPVRILLLARIALRLPSDFVPLIRINMDALGVLDLSQDLLSLDATLYDSKIMGYALSGDMALRVNWSGQREFLLAIGGFHPQFTPPIGFPVLKRIAIDMPSGPVTKMRLAAYLAVSSNTVQFGATLDVFIGVAGFGLAGHLGFDALLQLSPFHFSADISGSVALMAGGDNLMSVGLDASLVGPGPWHIAGSFKVHIIFFDVHKSFSYTWGDNTPAQQIAAVNVLTLISAAFADARNWGTTLPDTVPNLVSLRSEDGATLIAHPLAQLEAHQSIAPLGLQIERFGAAPLSGANTFTITDFRLNGDTLLPQTATVQDDFAPAQFFNLSDTEKLAGPSFEQHAAGLRLASEAARIAPSPLSKTIAYETFYIDKPGAVPRAEASGTQKSFVSVLDLTKVLHLGASARAGIRNTGKLRFQGPRKPVSIAPQKFTVADTGTLAPTGLAPAAGVTYSEAKALRAKATPGQRAQLQVLASHETAAS